MISFFQAQHPPLIGLDIGTDSLHWVELARDGRALLRLERCAVEPLAPGCIVQGQIERFEDVSAALKRLVRAAGSDHRRVALAMPASAVQTQWLTLPGPLSPTALEQQVQQAISHNSDPSGSGLAMDYGLGTCRCALVAPAAGDESGGRDGVCPAAVRWCFFAAFGSSQRCASKSGLAQIYYGVRALPAFTK